MGIDCKLLSYEARVVSVGVVGWSEGWCQSAPPPAGCLSQCGYADLARGRILSTPRRSCGLTPPWSGSGIVNRALVLRPRVRSGSSCCPLWTRCNSQLSRLVNQRTLGSRANFPLNEPCKRRFVTAPPEVRLTLANERGTPLGSASPLASLVRANGGPQGRPRIGRPRGHPSTKISLGCPSGVRGTTWKGEYPIKRHLRTKPRAEESKC
jgi:hypothetical protein